MNDYAAFFHPEIEGILQEIARDPKAKMLVVPSSGQLIRATHDSRVSIAAPGLTSAEVELLEVHRETVGELLKQRCVIEFYAAPESESQLHRSLDANTRLELRDECSWRTEAKTTIDLPIVDDRCQIGVDILARCVAKDERAVSIAQLATALSRVTPMDQAQVYMAIDLLQRDRNSNALKGYEQVLTRGTSPMLRSYCLEGLSVAHWNLGSFDQAKDLAKRAVSERGDRPVPIINWIDISTRMGEFKEAAIACELLDELECGDLSALSWFTDHEAARSRRGSMLPLSDESRSQVSELLSSTRHASREVLLAILF